MDTIHQYVQSKTDLVTNVIATAGIPAPLWVSLLDGAAKVVGIVYSVISITWVISQMWKARK